MELLQDLLSWRCCLLCRRKRSRYGYSIIRAPNTTVSSRSSLLSNISLDKPIPSSTLEFIEDHHDEIVGIMKDLKTSRILLEIPALGKRFTNQLAEHSFHESYESEILTEKDEILKQNLIYLASNTKNVERLQSELLGRKVLSLGDYTVVTQHKFPLMKALEMYKLTLKQKDSLGFIIGALKVTGNEYVAEVLIGSFPSVGADLICRISLTEAYSPEFSLKGEPKRYRVLKVIPRERQQILTSITCAYVETKGKTLLKSLEHCQQLTTLKLLDIKLRKDFYGKVHLPYLKHFYLHINEKFERKKDFFDHITPQRILSMLFFKVDENNNSTDYNNIPNHNPGNNHNSQGEESKANWDINEIWELDIDITIKIGGRTVLLVDHVKSRLFSRLENHYKIPENMIQPQTVRNLYLGWCRISKSSIPLHLTRLYLYSVNFIDTLSVKSREDLNFILKNSFSLREFKIWGSVQAQPWLVLKTSCFPPKLKTLSASFVEIQVDPKEDEDQMPSPSSRSNRSRANNLENICLFFYKVTNEPGFLDLLGHCKRISLSNFPPYQTPRQEQLLELIQRRGAKQILFCGCEHSLNFRDHFLYFQKPVVEKIQGVKNFALFMENGLWESKPLNRDEIVEHLHSKFSFEVLYSVDAFRQHEIISHLWK